MQQYKDFLIIGHPRGGTTYSSKLFKTFGFDVGHEVVGASGTASWLFAGNRGFNFWTDKRKRDEFYFKWTFLNVRNPLSTITSLVTENQRNKDSIKLVEQWTRYNISATDNPIEKATERYLIWDDFMWENNEIDFWFRVEDNQKQVYDHLTFLGYSPYYHLGEKNINEHIIPRNINTRPRITDKVTLDQIPEHYRGAVESKMKYYGYSLES